MFGIDSSELLFIALVALLVIGPKDLPRAMRWVGQWVGKGRAMSRHLRTGFDAMMRESEMEEMQKIWAAQNEAIMKATVMPRDALADLSAAVVTGSTLEPWPPAPAEVAPPVAEAPLATKKPRKPRAKKLPSPSPAPAVTPQGEEA